MRPLHFGLFIYPAGHHIAGWRHPSVDAGGIAKAEYYSRAAQTAERGRFDLFFVGDMLAARERDGRVVAEGGLNNLDSISITSAISAVTERLGLVATLSTTFNEPAAIAERFATLDHISSGRAGWNIITTMNDDAALNFSQTGHMEKTRRYERAREFVDICRQLWNSVDEVGAVRSTVDYAGEFFSVQGALRMPRPPQGWPVLVQAGGSPAGSAFAAEVAELVFAAQARLEDAKRFRADIHARLAQGGRRPGSLKIMPGVLPILGGTEAEARRKEEELDALIVPAVGIWMLSEQMNFRLYDVPPGAKLPVADIRASGTAFTPRVANMLDRAERDGLTVQHCALEVARTRSHGLFVGTPEQFADHVALWRDEGACDGFNIMPAYFPAELDVFVDEAVPVLRRRGLMRQDYEGTTLREHLDLSVPRA